LFPDNRDVVSHNPPEEFLQPVLAPSRLIDQLRRLSEPYGLLGYRLNVKEEQAATVTDEQVNAFLEFFSGILSDVVTGEIAEHVESLESLGESSASWTRIRISLAFPLLVERLRVVRTRGVVLENNPAHLFARSGPGEWTVEAALLENKAWQDPLTWRPFVTSLLGDPMLSGGICINVLEIPEQALRSGELDLRPVVLRNYDAEHCSADRTRPLDQKRVANSFWQTYWATGALRSERGQTFPVAFLPIERSHPREFHEPFHERYVSLRRRLLGRTSILAYVLESLTRARALYVDPRTGGYLVHQSYDPAKAEWPTTAADVALALDELERTGWIDCHTGANAELFSEVPSVSDVRPWPFGPGWSNKIRARGPAEDFLRSRRLVSDLESQTVRIHRIVPYAAAATLGQVFHETADLTASGKMPPLGGTILGGTNSTFFLNFAEEYGSLHSAMNDPVSTLVEDGHTHQLKTLRRAAFVLTQDGRALITTRLGNQLLSDVLVFEGEGITATAMRGACKPPGGNRVGPMFFGAVVVGNSIVETFEESASEVPMNGWVTGDSEAFGGRIEAMGAVRASLRLPGTAEETPIRHAFSVGPLLVRDGSIIFWGESREDFVPYDGPPFAANETRDLARTELPVGMSAVRQVGVAPTRFPHDWDTTRAPRTGLGVTAAGNVLLVVVDGRARLDHGVGVSLAELAEVMVWLGCKDAMNLDGGGSSVMYVADETAKVLRDDLRPGVVNLPSDLGGIERLLPVPLVLVRRDKI
jgi:hypothetical protein